MRQGSMLPVVILATAMVACTRGEQPPDPASLLCAPAGCRSLEVHEVGDDASPGWSASHDERGDPVYLRRLSAVAGNDIVQVALDFDDASGQPVIDVTLSPAACRRMQPVTESAIGKRLAFVSDGEVISSAYV